MHDKQQFRRLFEPGRIGQMELRNRIVMAPMMTRYASDDSFVTERTKNYYEARAKGGTGLIIVEFTYVHPSGRMHPKQLSISDDKYITGMSELADVIHKHGAKAALQLHHAGVRAKSKFTGMQPLTPSLSLQLPSDETPREMTIEDIKEITSCFAQAALRAKEAGFDAIEIHGAHGYLFNQFLSLASNKRKDAYGGSLRNRARFLVEVIKAIREVAGQDFPAWCRINGREYGLADGTTLEEAQETAQLAQEAGVDAIHVSAVCPQHAACGNGSPAITGAHPLEPGILVELAEGVKQAVNVPVITVGWITPEIGERALEERKADFVAMATALLADPELANKAASGRKDDITPCIRCLKCVDDLLTLPTEGIRCSVNARLGREGEYKIIQSESTKKVLVIGGGPAGMEAARVMALRGHEVTLYEQESKLGGQLIQAAVPPGKDKVAPLTRYLQTQISKLGVNVELNKEVTKETVKELRPDAVVVATGSSPVDPEIPGLSEAKVVYAGDVLDNKVEVGERVVIIGGELVGCETAEFLAEKGKEVTVTRRGSEMAIRVGPSLRPLLLKRLADKGVKLLPGVKYEGITSRGLALTTKEGLRKTIEADTTILAAGSQPNDRLFDELKGMVSEIYSVGDCVEPRTIRDAIAEGFRIGCKI